MALIGASSAIFYVRDPWYSSELRIACMEGVWARETMFGFLSAAPSDTPSAKKREDRRFFLNVRDDSTLCPRLDPPLSELVQRNRLWGSFSVREELVSAIRHRFFHPDGSVGAMLWLNFKNQRREDDKTRSSAMFFERLLAIQEAVTTELAEAEPFPISQVDRILQITPELASGHVTFEDYLQRVVESLLPTFRIDDRTGLGSAFLYRPANGELHRVAHAGYRRKGQTTVNKLRNGEGIVSWVALRKRSLLVSDMEGLERFRSAGIYLEVDSRTRSELTVPILLESELVGVLNFESRADTSPFSAQSLRALWYAATQAALAHRLHERTAVVRKLLATAERATRDAPESVIADLEFEGKKWIKSGDCRIWYRPVGESKFIDPGGRDQSARPRPVGWTAWAAQHQRPVWISEIKGDSDFRWKTWLKDERRWLETPGIDHPRHLNPNRNPNAVCALGVPILVAGEQRGGMWFIYLTPEPDPSAVTVEDAIGFAGQAGLVEEIIRHKAEAVVRADHSARFAQRFKDELFRVPDDVPGVDFYIGHQPKQNVFLGGDFHGVVPLDDRRTCFIVGDVLGKGQFAALPMIPVLMRFRESCRRSVSTRQVLNEMESACYEWHVKCTAICFAIDRAKDRIFCSRAGHHPLIVIRANGATDSFPREGIGEYDSFDDGPPSKEFGEAWLPIEGGAIAVAYTDGVSEAGAGSDEPDPLLGRGRIERIAVQNRRKSAREIADAIMQAALKYADGNPEDDLTIMVVKIVPLLVPDRNPSSG